MSGRADISRPVTILAARLAVFGFGATAALTGFSAFWSGCATCHAEARIAALSGPVTAGSEKAASHRASALNRSSFGPFPPVSLGVEEFLDRPGGNAKQAAEVVRGVLSSSPALAEGWLGLAQLTLADGGATSTALPLAEISRWLGPKEGRLMVRRAVFGFDRWSDLDSRQRAAAVTEGVQTVSSTAEMYQVVQIRDALMRQPPQIRTQILGDMAAAVPDGPVAVRRLSLR
ncbi:MAG: hypothetical protein O9972_60950 [Burkholderiales bacterium]|nr:hypothetical protein [Burkholderiales bacterium]